MSNKLILRETNSPYGDLNKKSVLSRRELDNNFIHLKGELIVSGLTTDNTIILEKNNGDNIVIPLPELIEPLGQDNRFRFVDLGSFIQGGRGVPDVDIETAFVNQLNIGMSSLNLIVADDELIILKISITIYGAFEAEERKYYFKGGMGKGVYNPLSDYITPNELELAFRDWTPPNVDILESSPNVNIFNLGIIPDSDYISYINNNGSYDLRDASKIHYFRFNYQSVDYLYFFDSNDSSYGNAIYGANLPQFITEDLVLFYDSSTAVIINSDAVFNGSYADLSSLVNTNQLIIGKNYILNDYVTKYQIFGSDSGPRIQIHEMIGSTGSYTQFNNVPVDIIQIGSVVTCVYAPPNALISSGDTFTIVEYFNFGYTRFSPNVTNPLNIGAKFRFQKQRYSNIPNDSVILDTYGKPVIKPNGVINTEVHDGEPYMAMTGLENPTPLVESIILKAIDSNKFSRNAESLIFVGDELTYDFNDNIIYDDNKTQIGERKGFILKRTNISGSISMDKDWRVQRYRRYKIDNFNWDWLLNKKEFSGNALTSGSTIYKMGDENYCTTTNPNLSEDHKYIMCEPFISDFHTDFAKTSGNPFISGTTSASLLSSGLRFREDNETTPYSVNVSLPLLGFSTNQSAKDFHIIPIYAFNSTNLTTKAVVKSLSNTVFLPYSQRYGSTFNLVVDSDIGDIHNSTFTTLITIKNRGLISTFTSIDGLTVNNDSRITNTINLIYGVVNNYGIIANSKIGGGANDNINDFNNFTVSDNSKIINSVIGGSRIDSLIFNDFQCNNSIIINRVTGYSTISGKWYLTMYKNFGEVYGSELRLNTFSNQKPSKGFWGHIYDFNRDYNDTQVNNFNLNKTLVTELIDGNLVRTIEILTTAS